MKKYAKSHEWFDTESGYVGISVHAQEQLGDIVYVDLPAVGKEVKREKCSLLSKVLRLLEMFMHQ